MCRVISSLFVPDLLHRLLTVDNYLPKQLTQPLHNLFIGKPSLFIAIARRAISFMIHDIDVALMADSVFKQNFSTCYATAYSTMVRSFGEGIGTIESAVFHLSVQFLNRDNYVTQIMEVSQHMYYLDYE